MRSYIKLTVLKKENVGKKKPDLNKDGKYYKSN